MQRILGTLMLLAVLCVPAVVAGAASARLARTSRGVWRVLSCIPPLPVLVAVVRIGWDTTRDPTSHNLWPIELMMYAFASLALYGVVLVGRRLAGGSEPAR